MNILALDTATDACSVAVMKGQNRFSRRSMVPQAHTKIILDLCDELLAESGMSRQELDLIVCGRGPGSFTGVRIGVAVAQGLAFGLGIKALGVSDLQALAQSTVREGVRRILVANDARMSEVYFCVYENCDGIARPLTQEQVAPPQQAADLFRQYYEDQGTVLIGSGFASYEPLKEFSSATGEYEAEQYPDALYMLDLALDSAELAVEPEQLLPVYLRDQVTWKKVSEQGKAPK